MTFAAAIALFVGLEILYGFMPDAGQDRWFADVAQWQAAALAWLAFAATPYESTGRKATVLVLLLYLAWIAATDWALAWFPPWGTLIECGLFVAFAANAIRKINAVAG